MLGESDYVASQEKEKIALQRVAEIRRLAVQLHIKQNMNSSSASGGGIELLRKEFIDKTKTVLIEFEISESYDFKLEFNEEVYAGACVDNDKTEEVCCFPNSFGRKDKHTSECLAK